MSTRVTIKDVRNRFEALVKVCQSRGIDTSKWRLQEGSSTYGRAYRLYDDGKGVLGLSQGFLGLTAAQAYHTLEVMLGVLWDLRERGTES